MKHEIVEKNVGLLAVLILVAISFGGLAEVVPLFFQKQTTEPVEGLCRSPHWSWKDATYTAVRAA